MHTNVGEAIADLRNLRRALRQTCDNLELQVASSGTHPFAVSREISVSRGERQAAVYGSMRELARREPTFALHVHVGFGDPDEAIAVYNRMRVHLPMLLALSANSPFWQGRDTGLASSRTPLFQAFPRVGVPRRFENFDEWVSTVRHARLLRGVPGSSFLWWDVRVQPRVGTIEVRIMDAQVTLEATRALVAMVQTLAKMEHEEAWAELASRAAPEVHDENRFLAARDGVDVALIDPVQRRRVPLRERMDALCPACASTRRTSAASTTSSRSTTSTRRRAPATSCASRAARAPARARAAALRRVLERRDGRRGRASLPHPSAQAPAFDTVRESATSRAATPGSSPLHAPSCSRLHPFVTATAGTELRWAAAGGRLLAVVALALVCVWVVAGGGTARGATGAFVPGATPTPVPTEPTTPARSGMYHVWSCRTPTGSPAPLDGWTQGPDVTAQGADLSCEIDGSFGAWAGRETGAGFAAIEWMTPAGITPVSVVLRRSVRTFIDPAAPSVNATASLRARYLGTSSSTARRSPTRRPRSRRRRTVPPRPPRSSATPLTPRR